jgi:hypothetical protein
MLTTREQVTVILDKEAYLSSFCLTLPPSHIHARGHNKEGCLLRKLLLLKAPNDG